MKLALLTVAYLYHLTLAAPPQVAADAIVGKWQSAQKNLIVNIFREGLQYKATVVWFKDTDDPSRPMATRTDYKNPDPKLRDRKVLGMEILNDLRYNSKDDRWEDGKIYDCTSGHEWSSSASLDNPNRLKVRGFWHFEFLGRTMYFDRLPS